MKTLLFIILISIAQFTNAQKNKPKNSGEDISIEDLQRRIDSNRKVNDELIRSMQSNLDSEYMARFNEQNQRNLEGFMAEQKSRSDKQFRAALIRGSIMLITVGLLIFGYIKRRKAKKLKQEGKVVV